MHRVLSTVPFVALLTAGLFLAGGATLIPTTAVARQAATPSVDDAIPYPTGEDDLVLRVEVGGGFVPVTAVLGEFPTFSLYGDGTVVTQGPVPEIFPGPALPNLRFTRLSEDGVQAVLQAARDAGLLERDRRFFNDRVADAPTTTVTVHADDRTVVTEAYALGIAEEDKPAAEREALRKLARFVEDLGDLPAWLPADAILEQDADYPIEHLQVVAQPVDPDATPADPALVPDPVAWPLATPLAEIGEPFAWPGLAPDARCVALDGADAARLVEVLTQANALTPWDSEGTLYNLYPRPLLPDETACAGDETATPAA